MPILPGILHQCHFSSSKNHFVRKVNGNSINLGCTETYYDDRCELLNVQEEYATQKGLRKGAIYDSSNSNYQQN